MVQRASVIYNVLENGYRMNISQEEIVHAIATIVCARCAFSRETDETQCEKYDCHRLYEAEAKAILELIKNKYKGE